MLKVKQDAISTRDFSASTDAEEEAHAALGMAHRVYTVGLDAILAGQDATPQPVALRVYETLGYTPRAFFYVTEDEQPRVLQMSAAKEQLDLFARGLTEMFGNS